MCVCVYIRMCMCVHVCMLCVPVCTCMHVYVRVCVCVISDTSADNFRSFIENRARNRIIASGVSTKYIPFKDGSKIYSMFVCLSFLIH